MNKPIVKFISLSLIIGLNWVGLSAVIETVAYYNDTEPSSENTFSAAMLDFSLTNPDIGGFIGVELGEDIEFLSVLTKTTGSLNIQYKARAEKISGNDDFCNALKLEAFSSTISYNGALLSFDTATTTVLGTWAFEVRLPHTATNFAQGEECNVDFVFEGWRDDIADFNTSGFNDEERIHLRLVSRMVVLNEFLPRPSGIEYGFDFGNDYSDMPQGEWVELYNNSDYDFDLAGWYIRDESATNKIMITASNTYPAGTIIKAKKWLVVYMNDAVLNNTGDTVKLFDNTDRLVDSYAYTTSGDYCDIEPTPAEENSTDTSGSPCGVPPNKSYARIPDGIGYWVDPIPTPGRMNVLEGENMEVPAATPETIEVTEEPIVEPVVETEISVSDTELTDEVFKEVIGDEVAPTPIEDVVGAPTESVGVEEVPVEPAEEVIPEVVPEVVPEEPPIIEEQPVVVEETIIEEQPAVVEEPPVVVEEIVQEPAPEPSLEPSGEGQTGQAEPEPSPTPEPII